MRRDAARNRQLVLDAARGVVADFGFDAGFNEIARRAGVGVGTVYRHLPDRHRLIDSLIAERIDQVVALADGAPSDGDSWSALVSFMERSVELQTSDRGLREVMSRCPRVHDRLAPSMGAMLGRAQRTGGVRPDIRVLDLMNLATMVTSMGSENGPDSWRRYLAVLLDGLRTHHVTPLNAGVPARACASVDPGRRSRSRASDECCSCW